MTRHARTRETARYIAGGALCAGLHNAILIAADALGVHYLGGMLLSLILVTPAGYLFQTLVTFRGPLSWRRFATFTIGVLAGFPLSLGMMALFCSGLRMPVVIATPLATILLFVWNYGWARRAILSRSHRARHQPARPSPTC